MPATIGPTAVLVVTKLPGRRDKAFRHASPHVRRRRPLAGCSNSRPQQAQRPAAGRVQTAAGARPSPPTSRPGSELTTPPDPNGEPNTQPSTTPDAAPRPNRSPASPSPDQAPSPSTRRDPPTAHESRGQLAAPPSQQTRQGQRPQPQAVTALGPAASRPTPPPPPTPSDQASAPDAATTAPHAQTTMQDGSSRRLRRAVRERAGLAQEVGDALKARRLLPRRRTRLDRPQEPPQIPVPKAIVRNRPRRLHKHTHRLIRLNPQQPGPRRQRRPKLRPPILLLNRRPLTRTHPRTQLGSLTRIQLHPPHRERVRKHKDQPPDLSS